MATTPLRESSSQTNPMRRIFSSRSSLLKPRSLHKCVRTTSPSKTSTLAPQSRSRHSRSLAMVLLPAPERPVSQTVNPLCMRRNPRHFRAGSHITKLLVGKIRAEAFELRHETCVHFALASHAQQFRGTALRSLAQHVVFTTPGNHFPHPEFF